MWDHIHSYSEQWWFKLPKRLKIVAFSKAVEGKAKRVGLKTLSLKYFPAPTLRKPISWKEGRVLFYWNRIGLITQENIISLCKALDIKNLFFQNQMDPKISLTNAYDLPPIIGKTKVHRLNKFLPRKSYIRLLQEANIYIAPRRFEGVGMTFIEAMAQGSFVLAYNGVTMNEYIHHKQNGFLISDARSNRTDSLHLAPKILDEISHLNMQKLGENAYDYNRQGYNK